MESIVQKQATQSKQLNSPINNLMDCLLVEILQRLPNAKSVIRCKPVSKRWFALISSPNFIRCFLHHHIINNDQPRPCTLMISLSEELFITSKNRVFSSRGFKLTYLPCSKPEERESDCVVASCSDLLLCCASMTDQSVYYICNPFTMHWIALPPTPSKDHVGIRVGFICEPFLSYEETQKECYTINPHYKYKVVRIPIFKHCSTLEIFSSETNKWTECEICVSPSKHFFKRLERTNIVGCNGMLYWLTSNDNIAAYNPYSIEQICFINWPAFSVKREGIEYWGYNHCLGVCRGFLRILRLTYSCNMSGEYDYSLSVWELKDYNTSKWSLEYEFSFNEMISKDSWVENDAKLGFPLVPQAIHPNDGDIVYLALCNHIISCNLKEKELKVACEENSICMFGDVFPIVAPWWPTPVPTL